MVLQAMMSFSVFAWLAPILRERGVDGGTAGLIVSASIVLQMLGSLFAPALATRFRDQRAINTVVALMTGGGFALSIFGPADFLWLWTGLLGLGQGSLTAAALTLIMVRTRDGHTAAHLSGMMQGVGYGLGLQRHPPGRPAPPVHRILRRGGCPVLARGLARRRVRVPGRAGPVRRRLTPG